MAGGNGSIGGTYHLATGQPPRRLVVGVDGREKEGKTNFALTAPGPIAYQNFDIGAEGVIQKFQTDKIIHEATYKIPISKGLSAADMAKVCEPVWDQFVKDRRLALDQILKGQIRSIVEDTGTDGWESLRLARLGKLTQVMPHHYGPVNAEYANLMREIYNTTGNLIVLHRLKPEYKDDKKTSRYERRGYGDTGFIVQVNVICSRDGNGDFHVTVKDCRQNPLLQGFDLVNEMATFPMLAMMVYPESSVEEWL